jgi:hypothetical protein
MVSNISTNNSNIKKNATAIAANATNISNEVTRAKTAEDELLKRVQGNSNDSSPSTDPFKLLITLGDINQKDDNGNNRLKEKLNTIHSTNADDDYAGQWRIIISNSAYTLYNIAKHYKSDQWMQIIQMPFTPTNTGWSIKQRQHTLCRSYINPGGGSSTDVSQNYWTEWEDFEEGLANRITALENRIKALEDKA